MSYGGLYTKWSTCSKSDFQAHVTKVNQMGQTWCMPASPNACSGGTTTTTTATTATTKTTSTATTTSSTTTTGGSGGSSCQPWWIGDGFCDPENNKAECLFDRGD